MTAHPLTPIAPPQGIYDEMLDEAGQCREHYRACGEWLASMGAEAMAAKRAEADLIFRRTGITFTVYGEEGGSERLIPSDVVPRIIPADDWALLERGLVQRVTAINRFLADIYHGREILRAGLIPAEDVLENDQYQPAMIGARLPHDTYAHIAGVDLVRHSDGAFYVLEDNLRVPSGVSYLLSNRRTMMRLFPDLFRRYQVRPVEHYPALLLHTLRAATEVDSPTVVLLTPGRYNSAYFEHAFLAQQMGIELVEGQDLFVRDSCVWMRTTSGPQRVDVIYRRLDDTFLDPLAFRPDSTLGVPGLMAAYRAGNVVIANAIGTGVADDKSIYPYVPEMIRFYLGEEPLLRNVPTWICRRPDDLAYVLAHLPELVVKEVHGAGGYGMLVGPTSTAAEIENFRRALVANPGKHRTADAVSLLTFVDEGRAAPYRPAPLRAGGREVGWWPRTDAGGAAPRSLVVNSSQAAAPGHLGAGRAGAGRVGCLGRPGRRPGARSGRPGRRPGA
jgi:uncharacterized circularly permuted ATP-grasp superfamily protein